MKGKKRSKKFWAIVGILVMIPLIGLVLSQMARQKALAVPLVETAVIQRGSLSSNIYVAGIVKAKDYKEGTANMSGRVASVHFEEGDRVEAGDIVVSLDTREISYGVMEAELDLDLIRRRTSSDLSAATRAFEEAREDFENKALLFEQGAVSRAEYETSERRFLDLQDEVAEIEEVSGKEMELEALRLEKLRMDFENSDIRAPISGTLTNLQVKEDGFVSLNQTLFVIQDLDRLEVLTEISEYDISRVKIGQEVRVKGQGAEEYAGRVSRIAPDALVVNSGQGSETVVEVVVELQEETAAFKPNFSAELKILTGSRDGVLLVPYEAVYMKKGGEKVVFLLGEKNTLKEIPIKTGMEGDLLTELIPIEESELEGRKAVLNPTENLTEGMAVREDEKTPAEEGQKP